MRNHQRLFLLASLLILGTLFFVTKNDPFFGDSISSISRAANLIYDSNFSQISYPENLDPGHPTTYPLIQAVGWKIFGRSLWVSHLTHLLFSIGCLYYFVRWSNKEGWGSYGLVGGILLLVTPLFVSQSVNPNMHLPLTFFSVGLVYALRFGKAWEQILFSSLLLVFHLQGLYYLAPIWLWWYLTKQDKPQTKIIYGVKILLIPGLLFLGWLMYHHSITGWYLSSPDYSGHRGMPGIKRIVVNLILADWRIVDYGQIALFALPIWAIFKKKIKWSWEHPLVLFLILFIFNSLALAVTTKTGPMHRYLLPCLPFLIMANVALMNKVKTYSLGIIGIVLLTGHFWFYPGKVMGDATLSYRAVFPLLEEAQKDVDGKTIHSYAPLSNPEYDTYLKSSKDNFAPLYDLKLSEVDYILYSNISGDFKTSELKELNENWPNITYEKGYVFVQVFSNPERVSQPKTGPTRQVSTLENWLKRLKYKIKGDDPT